MTNGFADFPWAGVTGGRGLFPPSFRARMSRKSIPPSGLATGMTGPGTRLRSGERPTRNSRAAGLRDRSYQPGGGWRRDAASERHEEGEASHRLPAGRRCRSRLPDSSLLQAFGSATQNPLQVAGEHRTACRRDAHALRLGGLLLRYRKLNDLAAFARRNPFRILAESIRHIEFDHFCHITTPNRIHNGCARRASPSSGSGGIPHNSASTYIGPSAGDFSVKSRYMVGRKKNADRFTTVLSLCQSFCVSMSPRL